MTLPPIDQHINQNIPEYTQDKFKLEGSSVIEKNEEYKGYLTIARNVVLHGKEYTVRKYIDKKDPNLDGKTQEVILQMYEKDMGDMVIKMVNLAIAYNLGKTKKDGNVISEIAISQDQSQILRNFTADKKDAKERIWKPELQRKFGKYENKENNLQPAAPEKDKVTEKKRAIEILLNIFPQVQPDPAKARVVFTDKDAADKAEADKAEAEKAKGGKKNEETDHLEIEELESDDADTEVDGDALSLVPVEDGDVIEEEEVESDEEDEEIIEPPMGSITQISAQQPSIAKKGPPQASIERDEEDDDSDIDEQDDSGNDNSVLRTESPSPDQNPPDGSIKFSNPNPLKRDFALNLGALYDESPPVNNNHLEATQNEIEAMDQAIASENKKKELASNNFGDANVVSDQQKHAEVAHQLKKDEDDLVMRERKIAEEELELNKLEQQIRKDEQALKDEIDQSQNEEKKKGAISQVELEHAEKMNNKSVVSLEELENNRLLINDAVANRRKLIDYLTEEFQIRSLQGKPLPQNLPPIPRKDSNEKPDGMNDVEVDIRRKGNFVLKADVFIDSAKNLLNLDAEPSLEQLQSHFKTIDGVLIRLKNFTNLVHNQIHSSLGVDLKDPIDMDSVDLSATDLTQATIEVQRIWILGLRKSILDTFIQYEAFDKLEKPRLVDVFDAFQTRNELLKPILALGLSNSPVSAEEPYPIKQFAKDLLQMHAILNSREMENSLKAVVEAMDRVTPGYKNLVYDLQPQLREALYGKPIS